MSWRLLFARCSLEVDFSKHGVWRNAVVMAGFAPKFCAKWCGRESHCFHGDRFRAKLPCLCHRHFLLTLIPKGDVVTKSFALTFSAECTDRHIHSSHGGNFRDHFCFHVSRQLSSNFWATFGQLPGNFRVTIGQLSGDFRTTFWQHSDNFQAL